MDIETVILVALLSFAVGFCIGLLVGFADKDD